jgi:outer membrane biosynthesis protein TonB
VKLKIDKTLVASVALHVLVIGWGLVSFATKAFESIPGDSVTVDVVSASTLAKAGMKSGNKAEPKPLVEKVAESRPADDIVGKISEKPPVVTETAPPPQAKVEDKPVEKKPDPPKPVAESKPKEEPKQAEKKPDPPKIDPIAEALKKEQKKPPPKPQAQAAAKPPEPAKPKAERVFDQSRIAALLDKRDPTHQAATGDALNSNAALGLAKGKAADNSATWGAMFTQQVLPCWKKPDRGIDTQRVEAVFTIRLRKDGTLEAMPVAQTSPTSAYQRVFLESGLRAIIDCAPYKLPPVFFEEWKVFEPAFDSREIYSRDL